MIRPILALGILLLCGFLGGRIANWIKFPRVTGYIAAGFLLSPSLFGIIPAQYIEDKFSVITDMALAIIAYSIGGSLMMSRVKLLGRSILWITITQALGAFALTFLLVAALGPFVIHSSTIPYSFSEFFLPLALIIGAVSAATAPGTILAIVREFRASGPMTTALLGVVALDDVIAIILFAFAAALAGTLFNSGEVLLYKMVFDAFTGIISSILLGLLFGYCLTTFALWIKSKESFLVFALAHIVLCTGIADQLNLSFLLANMMIGFVVINRAQQNHRLLRDVESIEEPIFILFFVLAGAHFNIQAISVAGPLALIIIVGRFSGKLIGTKIGASIAHSPLVIKKYLGYALLPKAGVTVGLVMLAQPILSPELGEILINGVLASVIINELISPPLVKYAIIKAGEAYREQDSED
jgi:Kef-type K+ transport system membrane component KefB